MSDTLVWISGATQGIGLGLARTVPWPDAQIVNLSRRQHPEYETVTIDLADPSTWDRAIQDFSRRLSTFKGGRAIFVHNAYVEAVGKIGEVDAAAYRASVIANCAGSLVLADAFVRACGFGYESGLVLLSSDSAMMPMPGMASYCAAKGGIEHWVETVRRERLSLGRRPWVVAVRPGAVVTPPVLAAAALDETVFPAAARVKASLATRVDIDEAGRRIWAALPPKPGVSVISFGRHPEGDNHYGGDQVEMLA